MNKCKPKFKKIISGNVCHFNRTLAHIKGLFPIFASITAGPTPPSPLSLSLVTSLSVYLSLLPFPIPINFSGFHIGPSSLHSCTSTSFLPISASLEASTVPLSILVAPLIDPLSLSTSWSTLCTIFTIRLSWVVTMTMKKNKSRAWKSTVWTWWQFEQNCAPYRSHSSRDWLFSAFKNCRKWKIDFVWWPNYT